MAPLALRGQALGVVSFYRHQQQDPFEEEDVAVASAVCAHAALCIDNARQYMREWIVAQTVQRRLLPQPTAAHTTVDLSHLHLPSPEGGGAWFDAIALPGARTALIVGDVAGHGIAAAITMGLLRTAIHTLAALDLQPDELLARLSDTAGRLAAAYAELPMDPLDREPLTAGCVIAVYDPVELTCTIARAGLPEPVVALPDGTSAGLSVPQGPHSPKQVAPHSPRRPSASAKGALWRWARPRSRTRSWRHPVHCARSWTAPAQRPCRTCATTSHTHSRTATKPARH